MKTDRELLELAANAAGYTLVWGDVYIIDGENIDCTDLPYVRSNQQDEADWYWNPLEDDGDALRLAVKLRLSIIQEEESVSGEFFYTVEVMSEEREDGSRICMMQSIEENPMQATRRAIVRTAAEIGKAMP